MNLDIATQSTSPESITVHVVGDVDYLTTATLVATVTDLLATAPALRDLRFELTGMSFCDSAGLSGFIQIHRRTSSAGIHLHLDDMPPHFERILDLTGVLEHLTAPPSGVDESVAQRYEGGGSNS